MRKTIRRAEAIKDKSAHMFKHGVGYIAQDPQHPKTPVDRKLGIPAKQAKPGSLHWLEVRGARLLMRWDGSMWEHPQNPGAGNRLAWWPEYLVEAGWKYIEPYSGAMR